MLRVQLELGLGDSLAYVSLHVLVSLCVRKVHNVSWPKMGASSPRKIRTPSKKRLLGRNGSFFGHKIHPTVARKGNFDLDEYLIYYLRAVKFLGQIYSPFNAKIAPINV